MTELQMIESTQQAASKDVRVLAVVGHLDGHTYRDFEAKLNEVVESGCYSLVIDFEQLDYISSAGLGALLNAHTRTREHEGDLKIACLSDKTSRLFDLLGFSHVLQVYDTVDAAVQSFASASG